MSSPEITASEWTSRPPFRQAVAAARAYWQRQDLSYEEDVRVFGSARGAFTRPGADQEIVLFMMSPWPRCCSKLGLAVVEGGRLVRNVAFNNLFVGVRAVPDLNGDGRDDLELPGEFGMGGETSGTVTLAGFGDTGFAEMGSTSLSSSDCGGSGTAGSMAQLVTASPGPTQGR